VRFVVFNPSRFAAAAEKWVSLTEFVFCNGVGTMANYSNIREKRLLPLLEMENIQHLKGKTLHSFRHSFATIHLQNGTPIEWVSRQLGHSKVETTFSTLLWLPSGTSERKIHRCTSCNQHKGSR
jgi:integrase